MIQCKDSIVILRRSEDRRRICNLSPNRSFAYAQDDKVGQSEWGRSLRGTPGDSRMFAGLRWPRRRPFSIRRQANCPLPGSRSARPAPAGQRKNSTSTPSGSFRSRPYRMQLPQAYNYPSPAVFGGSHSCAGRSSPGGDPQRPGRRRAYPAGCHPNPRLSAGCRPRSENKHIRSC